MSVHFFVIMIFFVIGLIFISHLIATHAQKSGLSYAPIFILGLITSPIIQFIVVLIMESNIRNKSIEHVSYSSNKTCPFCAETIKFDAVVCRYCNKDLPLVELTTPCDVEVKKIMPYSKMCKRCNLRHPEELSVCPDCDLPLENA